MSGVSLQGINGAVMLAGFETESRLDFNCLSLVSLQDVPLLGTDEVLERTGILVVLQRGTSEDFSHWLVTNLESLREDELIDGAISEFLEIPPKDAAISGSGHALSTRLTDGQPVNVVYGVVMGFLEQCGLHGLDHTRR